MPNHEYFPLKPDSFTHVLQFCFLHEIFPPSAGNQTQGLMMLGNHSTTELHPQLLHETLKLAEIYFGIWSNLFSPKLTCCLIFFPRSLMIPPYHMPTSHTHQSLFSCNVRSPGLQVRKHRRGADWATVRGESLWLTWMGSQLLRVKYAWQAVFALLSPNLKLKNKIDLTNCPNSYF